MVSPVRRTADRPIRQHARIRSASDAAGRRTESAQPRARGVVATPRLGAGLTTGSRREKPVDRAAAARAAAGAVATEGRGCTTRSTPTVQTSTSTRRSSTSSARVACSTSAAAPGRWPAVSGAARPRRDRAGPAARPPSMSPARRGARTWSGWVVGAVRALGWSGVVVVLMTARRRLACSSTDEAAATLGGVQRRGVVPAVGAGVRRSIVSLERVAWTSSRIRPS